MSRYAYTFRLRHTGTNRVEGPDFDWCALVDDSDQPGPRQDRYGTGGIYVVKDPDYLLHSLFSGDVVNLARDRTCTIQVPGVDRPSGEVIGKKNSAFWRSEDNGLIFNCEISPALPPGTEAYWTLDPDDFPAGPETKITWDPWDVANNRPHVGVGSSPTLVVTYENPQSKYDDFMPPDNRWFGQKKIIVQIGNETITRPVWFFFIAKAERPLRQGGKKEEAWFHYYKDGGVVPNLEKFEFDISLEYLGTYSRGKYTIGPKAYARTTARKPVFNVNAVGDSYSEVNYPKEEKFGLHNVAKICAHECWHGILAKEVGWIIWGGLGHLDSDRDRLSDAREMELGTKPNVKDTCGISRYTGDINDYILYASYADNELFCRWKQNGILGDVSKDWAFLGTQYPVDETED